MAKLESISTGFNTPSRTVVHFYFVAKGQSYFDEKGHIFPPTGVNLNRLFQGARFNMY